jgi:SAM-dependent methyltransferase
MMFFNLIIKKYGIKINQTLDIGCGEGFFTNLLDDIGFNVCGLDLDMKNLKEACKKYHSNFLIGDARQLPFSPNTFDLILSRGLSTFYTDNIESASEQRNVLLKLLKTGGILVFITSSNLSGKRTTIQNHEINNVLKFFTKQNTEAEIFFFFAKNRLFNVIGGLAFNSLFTKLSRILTKITKRSGYIICIIKKQS